MKDQSRRYLLLLDSIRHCEGVAKLLLSKPGELVDVKPSKNRVSPMSGKQKPNPTFLLLFVVFRSIYEQDELLDE